jgi:hypothetical protein
MKKQEILKNQLIQKAQQYFINSPYAGMYVVPSGLNYFSNLPRPPFADAHSDLGCNIPPLCGFEQIPQCFLGPAGRNVTAQVVAKRQIV